MKLPNKKMRRSNTQPQARVSKCSCDCFVGCCVRTSIWTPGAGRGCQSRSVRRSRDGSAGLCHGLLRCPETADPGIREATFSAIDARRLRRIGGKSSFSFAGSWAWLSYEREVAKLAGRLRCRVCSQHFYSRNWRRQLNPHPRTNRRVLC